MNQGKQKELTEEQKQEIKEAFDSLANDCKRRDVEARLSSTAAVTELRRLERRLGGSSGDAELEDAERRRAPDDSGLGYLKTLVARVGTGEGKSVIIAMLAVFLAHFKKQ